MQSYQAQQYLSFDPFSSLNPLPQFSPDFTVNGWAPGWNSTFTGSQMPYAPDSLQNLHAQQQQRSPDYLNDTLFDPDGQHYPFRAAEMNVQEQYLPQLWDMDPNAIGNGLNQTQHQELMHSLETEGMEDIQHMITATGMTTKGTQRPQL